MPFEAVIPETKRDPEIKRHLRDDPEARSALLAWAVAGCLAWQRHGLKTCDLVRTRTAELRAEMDPLSEFLKARCTIKVGVTVMARDLRKAYEDWAGEMGAKPINDREWGKRLKAKDCESERQTRGERKVTIWRGIGLLAEQEGQLL